jgi:hypothetical protein
MNFSCGIVVKATEIGLGLGFFGAFITSTPSDKLAEIFDMSISASTVTEK